MRIIPPRRKGMKIFEGIMVDVEDVREDVTWRRRYGVVTL